MNLKSLRAFRLIVSEGSLAAAAATLNLSQPAVSRLISLLEAETKLKLFNRTRRRLTMSEVGEAFYRETQHILDGVDEIPHIADKIRSGSNQPFRVITGPRIGEGLVSPALALMRREHPALKCIVDVPSRFDLEIKSGIARYDLGIASLPVSHTLVPIENQPLCQVRMEAVMPASHPLAEKAVLTAGDLAAQPIVGMWPSQFWRRQVDEFFRSGGIVPSYAVECTSSLMGCQMARDGAGIAIIDRISVRAIDPKGMAIRPLDPPHWLLYGFIYQKGQILTENAKTFLDCVRRYIDDFRSISPETAQSVVPHWGDPARR